MATEVGHDGPGGAVGGFTHVLVPVPEAEEEIGEKVNHVRLKQSPQHVTQTLKGKQRSLSVAIVFLVFYRLLKCRHDSVLFQRRYPEPLDQSGQSVRRPSPLAVAGRFEKLIEEFRKDRVSVRLDDGCKGRDATGDGLLDGLRRSVQVGEE